MGVHTDHKTIVDEVIGPGPNARQDRYRFEPDLVWQHARIAERYISTNGLSTYLGDWHSHPYASDGELSSIDRLALRTISKSSDAQCPEPIMLIFWGSPKKWSLSAWRMITRTRRLVGRRFIVSMNTSVSS